MGDVVLGLPALEAIRNRFPHARITVAAGKSASGVIELSGYADEVLKVDRVALRDGAKPLSVYRIVKLAYEVRRRKFDFVIDLHSLPETNILGFVSGAPQRLYAERITRSLDFLGNFPVRPPRYDVQKHIVERYLDVLTPLGIKSELRAPMLPLREEDERSVDEAFRKARLITGSYTDAPLIGMFPGAGHASRQWRIERFAELADKLRRDEEVRVLLFPGPEERALVKEYRKLFGDEVLIFDRFTLGQFAAAARRLSVFVSNDTGPMHIAAAVGAPVVMLLGRMQTSGFHPVGAHHEIVLGHTLDEITVDKAFIATRTALNANRTTSLFNR